MQERHKLKWVYLRRFTCTKCVIYLITGITLRWAMHSSAKLQSPPLSVLLFCSCDKVHHKQKIRFLVFTKSDSELTNITLLNWFKIEHTLVFILMINSCKTVRSRYLEIFHHPDKRQTSGYAVSPQVPGNWRH